jgi:hypothetical protein
MRRDTDGAAAILPMPPEQPAAMAAASPPLEPPEE